MRIGFLVFAGLFLASIGAQAQTSVQSFTWERNSRFELRFNQKTGPVVLKGELRDGARQSFQTKDLQTTAEFKSYTTELFVVVAITNESDDTGYIFLLERPQETWLIMNRAPIRARKIDIMNDFETAVKDFKATTDHTFANILRKMTEYFDKNPTKRLQDLLAALENKDEGLRSIPRPRGGTASGNQGVIPGDVPRPAAPGQNPDPGAVLGEPGQRPARRPLPIDPYAPRPPADVYGDQPDTSVDDDYAQRERARQRRIREQRRREQLQQQQQFPQVDPADPYAPQRRPYYPSERPVDIRPGMQPRYNQPNYYGGQPQYAPRPQYAPPRQRGLFESLFGQ